MIRRLVRVADRWLQGNHEWTSTSYGSEAR